MEKQKSTREKPFDLSCMEEYEHLQKELVNTIQKSNLPIFVLKIAIVQIINDLIVSIDKEIENLKINYYQTLDNDLKENHNI